MESSPTGELVPFSTLYQHRHESEAAEAAYTQRLGNVHEASTQLLFALDQDDPVLVDVILHHLPLHYDYTWFIHLALNTLGGELNQVNHALLVLASQGHLNLEGIVYHLDLDLPFVQQVVASSARGLIERINTYIPGLPYAGPVELEGLGNYQRLLTILRSNGLTLVRARTIYEHQLLEAGRNLQDVLVGVTPELDHRITQFEVARRTAYDNNVERPFQAVRSLHGYNEPEPATTYTVRSLYDRRLFSPTWFRTFQAVVQDRNRYPELAAFLVGADLPLPSQALQEAYLRQVPIVEYLFGYLEAVDYHVSFPGELFDQLVLIGVQPVYRLNIQEILTLLTSRLSRISSLSGLTQAEYRKTFDYLTDRLFLIDPATRSGLIGRLREWVNGTNPGYARLLKMVAPRIEPLPPATI